MIPKMIEVDNEEIVGIAKQYSKDKILWHNHFLTKGCIYNTSYNKNRKFQIVIENEQSGEIHISNFEEQPTKKLRLLEDLFFKQTR